MQCSPALEKTHTEEDKDSTDDLFSHSVGQRDTPFIFITYSTGASHDKGRQSEGNRKSDGYLSQMATPLFPL